MITPIDRATERAKIHARIRRKISGSGGRPRLCVFRSLAHIYVQVVDDMSGKTLASAVHARERGMRGPEEGGKHRSAKQVGKAIAERAKARGIEAVVFDRGGYLYTAV